MFSKLKSALGMAKTDIIIHSPIQGEAVPVTEVNDPTFAQEIVGRGVAIKPTSGRAVSPVNGTVEMVFETGHAVSLRSDDGVEIIIHVGLDTVNLKGKHYTKIAKQGDKVSIGDSLLEFDLEGIRADGYDTITPVVICNTPEFSGFDMKTGKNINEGDELIVLHK